MPGAGRDAKSVALLYIPFHAKNVCLLALQGTRTSPLAGDKVCGSREISPQSCQVFVWHPIFLKGPHRARSSRNIR